MNYFETLNDGAPCEGKLSCTVLSGGKSGDGIKGLPIAIRPRHPLCLPDFQLDCAEIHLEHHWNLSSTRLNRLCEAVAHLGGGFLHFRR